MYQKVCIIYRNLCFVYHKNLVANGQLVIEIISFEVGWLGMCGIVLLFTKNNMASNFTLNQTHHMHTSMPVLWGIGMIVSFWGFTLSLHF